MCHQQKHFQVPVSDLSHGYQILLFEAGPTCDSTLSCTHLSDNFGEIRKQILIKSGSSDKAPKQNESHESVKSDFGEMIKFNGHTCKIVKAAFPSEVSTWRNFGTLLENRKFTSLILEMAILAGTWNRSPLSQEPTSRPLWGKHNCAD